MSLPWGPGINQSRAEWGQGNRRRVLTLGQHYHRRKLAKLISKTSLYDIAGMTWSAWAIQNGHADIARRYMRFPPQATNSEIDAPYAIFPWFLETLVNEAMVLPLIADRRGRQLVTQEFSAIRTLTELVRKIEESDDRAFLRENDVLYEMHRLTQRQFEWQRGFINQPRFYRALVMFADGASGSYFESKSGCSVPEFIQAAFLIFAGSASSPTRRWDEHPAYEDVSVEQCRRVLDAISIGATEAEALARTIRAGGAHIGYEPSVLRQYPILRFGKSGANAMAPLPPLVLQRASSGLYFDVIDGGGSVREDIGRRFESYCHRYLQAMLEGANVAPESRYGSRGRSFDSPDILVSRDGAVRMVVECKARRMSIEARFSGDPVGDAVQAYTEIAKGVFQVWRFFSHARRGLYDPPVAPDCLGMVLTADPWLVMGQKLNPEVMAIAHRIADEKDSQILAEDRRRVPVVLIDDLEYLLQHTSADTLFERVASVASDESGWNWSLVHGLGESAERAYPFTSELAERLPRIFGRAEVSR